MSSCIVQKRLALALGSWPRAECFKLVRQPQARIMPTSVSGEKQKQVFHNSRQHQTGMSRRQGAKHAPSRGRLFPSLSIPPYLWAPLILQASKNKDAGKMVRLGAMRLVRVAFGGFTQGDECVQVTLKSDRPRGSNDQHTPQSGQNNAYKSRTVRSSRGVDFTAQRQAG